MNYLNSLKMKLVKAGEITTLTMEATARTMEADAVVEEVVLMAIEVVEEVAEADSISFNKETTF
jgi:hypothetical protein